MWWIPYSAFYRPANTYPMSHLYSCSCYTKIWERTVTCSQGTESWKLLPWWEMRIWALFLIYSGLHLLGLDGQVILWTTAHPFDFSSYQLSAYLKKTGCIGATWGTRTISILTVNINLGVEILNVRFYCHLTPNVFVYSLVLFQSSGCHLESHSSKTSPPAIKHETLVQGAILELSTFHSRWNFWEILK